MKVTTLVAFSFNGSFKNVLDYILSNLYLVGEPQSICRFDFPRRNIFITPICCIRIIFSSVTTVNATLLMPRGNSRLIIWLLRLSAFKTFITYSDGLGDCIDDFALADHPKYLGHIGFSEITKFQNLLASVPLENAIEGWHSLIRYSPNSPALLLIKIPKEIDCPLSYLVKFYSRLIKKITINNSRLIYISCSNSLGRKFTNKTIVNVGSLNNLNNVVYASSVIGLPSTIFLSLDKSFPHGSIRIINTPSKKTYPKAYKRTRIMAKLASECRKILYPQ